MKRAASLFLIAILAGAMTLGAYILFIEKPSYAIVANNDQMPIITTSNTPASFRGAGINEVDFTTAAETTVNAVVHVKNVTVSKGRSSLAEFFYGSEAAQRPQVGTGSGVIISPDGYIVTNNHVIAKANQLMVTLNNNRTYDAEVIGTDQNSDIALIKINADEALPYLAFGDSDNVRIGEWVLAVGNPFNLTSTVTAGIVSAKARALVRGDQSFIQTDAAVNPGNSGGALVNTNGDLIGINTAISSQTGSYVGYSFAVPSNIAKKVVEDIMEFGSVQKGILGISAVNVNTPYAKEKGISEIQGVYVDVVTADSGADDADIRSGDIIKQVDNIKVNKFADLTGYLSTKRPGDEVSVSIERGGDELILPVTLKERQSLVLSAMGIVVKNLNEKEKKKFKTDKGVIITGVPESYRGYPLEGKVIISVDDDEVENIEDARKLFDKIDRYSRTSITIITEDGEKERFIFQ